MDDVAAAAGVGKGTLYRRFGDKSGLAAALLDERESELQAALLSGPPPLGPGAPPADRLAAFTAAYLAYVDAHLDIVALSQTASPGARLRIGSHRMWQQHCQILLTTAGVPDPAIRADTLLAALTAEQVRHWRRDENRPLSALTAAIVTISRRSQLLTSPLNSHGRCCCRPKTAAGSHLGQAETQCRSARGSDDQRGSRDPNHAG
jgi:AcrR family transcriptional regulator